MQGLQLRLQVRFLADRALKGGEHKILGCSMGILEVFSLFPRSKWSLEFPELVKLQNGVPTHLFWPGQLLPLSLTLSFPRHQKTEAVFPELSERIIYMQMTARICIQTRRFVANEYSFLLFLLQLRSGVEEA